MGPLLQARPGSFLHQSHIALLLHNILTCLTRALSHLRLHAGIYAHGSVHSGDTLWHREVHPEHRVEHGGCGCGYRHRLLWRDFVCGHWSAPPSGFHLHREREADTRADPAPKERHQGAKQSVLGRVKQCNTRRCNISATPGSAMPGSAILGNSILGSCMTATGWCCGHIAQPLPSLHTSPRTPFIVLLVGHSSLAPHTNKTSAARSSCLSPRLSAPPADEPHLHAVPYRPLLLCVPGTALHLHRAAQDGERPQPEPQHPPAARLCNLRVW